MAEHQTEGIILKGIGGFYYISTVQGTIVCRARGIFRKDGITPVTGDRVTVQLSQDGTGTVQRILPRKTVLTRPPVANVTQIAIVTATANPRPNLLTLDKMIAESERQGLRILLCMNKTDLNAGAELCAVYEAAGFQVLKLCALHDENTAQLREQLRGHTTVFAGNSGVGKSSLLNRLLGSDSFETGSVSDKVERGRHTTRHSELVELEGGGFLIDTPGFSSFELQFSDAAELSAAFREFRPYEGACKFHDCSHTTEKGCAVLNALADGKIALSRHQNYVQLYQMLKQKKSRESR